MGLIPVPNDHCAAIVTHLEMTRRPLPRPIPVAPAGLSLIHWPAASLANYRALFARIGTPWLWFSRAVMPDAALAAILGDGGVDVYAVIDRQGLEVGMVELDYRASPNCEIAYFGLIPELAGRGIGRWLMAETLMRA